MQGVDSMGVILLCRAKSISMVVEIGFYLLCNQSLAGLALDLQGDLCVKLDLRPECSESPTP